uniref:Uncharacterized protein n=1 Tax=Calcidiscus leptoporus TaxID=127549 RepID=A0A7S0NTW6_9EUKA
MAKASNGLAPWEMAKEDEMRALCCGEKLVLHAAVRSCDVKQVQSALRDGADVSRADRDGFTALHLAIAAADSEEDALEMLHALLQAKAGRSAPSLAIAFGTINREGYMPLHLAALKGSAALAAALLEAGAPIDAKSRLRGAGYDGNWGKRETKSAQLEEIDSRHRTALQLALERLEKSEEGDDSDDDDGGGGGDAADDDSGVDLVRVLLRHKADVNTRDINERTPLEQAVDAGRHGVVKLLLEADAEPTAVGKRHGVLHQAVIKSDACMVELLLKHNAEASSCKPAARLDVNGCGRDGWTPLALAARAGHTAAAELLLEYGAAPTVVMANGKTALDIARVNKKDSIVALLG